MNNFTPQQQQMLQTWAEKRDLLIRDIGTFQTELDILKVNTKSEGLALADLHIQLSEAKGHLAEIAALEERHKNSMSIEVMNLEKRKSALEAECTALDKKNKATYDNHALVMASTLSLESAHEIIKKQSNIVDSVVGKIIELSNLHLTDVKTVMMEIKNIADHVISKGNENIAQTNIVLEKMPKFIFDMQKPIPVRRTYEVGHPKHGAQDLTTS